MEAELRLPCCLRSPDCILNECSSTSAGNNVSWHVIMLVRLIPLANMPLQGIVLVSWPVPNSESSGKKSRVPPPQALEDAFYSDDELAECLHAEELGLAPSPTSKASAFAASFVTTSISQHVSLHIGTGILAGWSLPEPYPLLQALELLRGDPFCPDVPARGFRNYYTAPSQLPHPRDSAALLLVALKALALCLGEVGRTHLQP